MAQTYAPRVISLAWIRKEHYLAITSLHDDAAEKSWQQWETRATKVEAGLKARGYIVKRVFVDPEKFAEWSKRKDAKLGPFRLV